jgi:hypothetical protein
MSAVAGEGTAKITLTKNTRKESTSAFSFMIDAAAAPEDYWSDYEMSYYESVLSRIDEAALVAADAQEYAETAEASATAAAASASQARAIAMADVIACYPVGSVLITTTNTNPGTIIGGTWTAMEGRFLLAQSESHPAGTTGGSEKVTLTVNQIPEHVHNLSNLLKDSGGTDNIGWTGYAFKNSSVHPLEEIINTKPAGGGQAHNNMPPYVAVYVWERTA